MEAIQHVPVGHPLRQRKDGILARCGAQAKKIAKVAARAPAAHLGLLRDARRPGSCPGLQLAEGGRFSNKPGA
jgi:hypothetical protein